MIIQISKFRRRMQFKIKLYVMTYVPLCDGIVE